jgi:predicted dehydrogenase
MIRIGIIGAGPNATGHGKYYRGCGRAKVVAVADPALDRAETLAKDCDAKAVADYQQFLSDVDAVVVASPNFLHKEQAIACAKAGKHVYCEKPVGLSGADAIEMAAAARAAKVKTQVGFSVSIDGNVQEMLRRLKSGELGELVSTASRRLCWQNAITAGWRADHNLSGGLLFEINIHEIEWMMRAGDVQSVYARKRAATQTGPRANDHIWVTLNYANGGVGTHEGSWASAAAMYYRNVQGVKGAAFTNEWGNELYVSQGAANRETVKAPPGFDIRGNFLDAVEGKAATTHDLDWGVKVMAVADAILESARTNQAVPVAAAAAKR